MPSDPESPDEVLLRLFVTGTSQRSLRAIEAVRDVCRHFPGNRVKLDIIDVIAQPEAAETEKILATPTLIRARPGPPRRLVGDLADAPRVIELLGLHSHIHPQDDQ